jgi:hypothetical protein
LFFSFGRKQSESSAPKQAASLFFSCIIIFLRFSKIQKKVTQIRGKDFGN